MIPLEDDRFVIQVSKHCASAFMSWTASAYLPALFKHLSETGEVCIVSVDRRRDVWGLPAVTGRSNLAPSSHANTQSKSKTPLMLPPGLWQDTYDPRAQ
jgi:hypothetical protein